MSLRVWVDTPTCEPGDRVTGQVEWDVPDEDREILVSVLWHTAGKGSEHVEVVAQQRFPPRPSTGIRSFGFDLPTFPWSFSGRLVGVAWAVEASVEPGGDVDRADFVMGPGRTVVTL